MKRYIPLDENTFRDISKRKTSLEQDPPYDDEDDGMEWLHSCPLDDDLEIGQRQIGQAGQRGANGEPDVHRTALQDVCILARTVDTEVEPDADRDAATRTPELCACAIGSEVNNTARVATAAPLFSLFRPKTQRKVLVVIRHGESEYNAAARQADQWADPKLYDPSLTARGCQQARQLRIRLAAEMKDNQGVLSGHSSTAWVTSPLRRCIQTFLLSCPLLPDTPADRSGSAQNSGAVVQQVQEKIDVLASHKLPPVRIVSASCSCISERVLTYGDIGTQTSQLKKEFVPLKDCFQLDHEYWWHGGASNDKNVESFGEKESSVKVKVLRGVGRAMIAGRWKLDLGTR